MLGTGAEYVRKGGETFHTLKMFLALTEKTKILNISAQTQLSPSNEIQVIRSERLERS
jgi:hypothetical protein